MVEPRRTVVKTTHRNINHWSLLDKYCLETNVFEVTPATALIANHARHLEDGQIHGNNQPTNGDT